MTRRVFCCKKSYPIKEINLNMEQAKKDLNINIEDLQSNKDNFKNWTKSCFVVFDNISDYDKYFEYFPHTWYKWIVFNLRLMFSCCQIKAKGKSTKWMRSFKVEKAPEPEDVMWENFVYSDKQRFGRIIFTFFLTILLTLLNLCIVIALNYADVKFKIFKVNLILGY